MSGILGPKLGILIALVRLLRPQTYIEVGCYRCGTMKAIRDLGIVDRIIGFDMFEPHDGFRTDKGMGMEDAPLDGPPCTVIQARAMGFEVYEGDSKTTLGRLSATDWNNPALVFIDGGHSFETVSSDFEKIKRFVKGAVIVLDDVSYPGPAKLVASIDTVLRANLGNDLVLVYPDP